MLGLVPGPDTGRLRLVVVPVMVVVVQMVGHRLSRWRGHHCADLVHP
ncbi:MAG: hypothetical protein PVG27_05255 [Chloroflexota bacterium]